MRIFFSPVRGSVRDLILMTAVLAVAGSFTACKDKTTAEDVKEEVSEAGKAIGEFTEAKRKEYQQAMSKQLENLGERAEKLRADLAGEGTEANTQQKEAMEAIDKQLEAVREKLNEMGESAEEGWEDTKDELDEMMDDLEDAFEELSQ